MVANKKISIRKIAQMAQCSPSAVSSVLSGRANTIRTGEETRKRILHICDKLDYHPTIHATRLLSKRSRTIGFLVDEVNFMFDENFGKSFIFTCSEALKNGYRCLPLIYSEQFIREKEYINVFKRNEIDAMVIWGASENDLFIHELHKKKYPFCLIANKIGEYPAVSSDQYTAVKTLTETAVAHGASRIAGIFYHPELSDSFRQRLNAFRDIVEPLKSDHLITLKSKLSDYKDDPGFAGQILDFKPDAIICINDGIAVLVEQMLLGNNRKIPEEVMISGGDNLNASDFCQVPITSYNWKADEMAQLAVDKLISYLENGTELESQILSADIIWRNSLPCPTQVTNKS